MFHHLYNLTFLNERCVELAIAHAWLKEQESQSLGIEVGNVLGHYCRREHMVVDKYEPPAWYQRDQPYCQADVFDLVSSRAPWVVSLSTIEHTKNPAEALGIIGSFAPVGLVTFPTGIDPTLDSWLEEGAPGPYSVRTLCRVQNDHGGWEETILPQVRPYGPWANCVAVVEWMP
jgi:hypothetical protein